LESVRFRPHRAVAGQRSRQQDQRLRRQIRRHCGGSDSQPPGLDQASSISDTAIIAATSTRKIRLPGVPIVHIDRSDAFTRQPCSLKTAARLAVLIWIKSCALPAAVIEDGWHRVAVMT
jgi:hypothetical protein